MPQDEDNRRRQKLNLTISDEARERLDELSEHYKESRSRTVERSLVVLEQQTGERKRRTKK